MPGVGGAYAGDGAGWDALPPTIPRPKSYGPPQNVQMINTECPYTGHGLSVRNARPRVLACPAVRRA